MLLIYIILDPAPRLCYTLTETLLTGGNHKMSTLEIPVAVTIDHLMEAIEQLPPQELADFVRRVIAIQARR